MSFRNPSIVAHWCAERYIVFEALLHEGAGWSDQALKDQGTGFSEIRFHNIKAFYFIEFNNVGLQVYRVNDANPVRAVWLCPLCPFICAPLYGCVHCVLSACYTVSGKTGM